MNREEFVAAWDAKRGRYAGESFKQQFVAAWDAKKLERDRKALIKRTEEEAKSVSMIPDEYKEYLNASDFEEYSQKGAAIENPTYDEYYGGFSIGDWRPFGKDIGNIVTFSRDNEKRISLESAKGLATGGGGTVGNWGYKDLTNDEVSIYNYLLGKGDTEKADEYLKVLDDIVNQRQGEKIAKQAEGNKLGETAFGVLAGLENFGTGVANLGNLVTGAEARPSSAIQYAGAYMRSDMEKDGWGWVYDTSSAVGGMLPSILLTVATGGAGAPTLVASGVGAVSMGLSAAGNGYAEMRRLGYNEWQSRGYGLLIGASEAVLQYILGGIGKLGGKVFSKLGGKALVNFLGKFDNALARVAINIGKSSAGELLGSMASEGLEEGLQTVLEPMIKCLATGEDFEAAEWDDVMYSAVIGAITAGVLEGPSIAVNAQIQKAADTRTGHRIIGLENSQSELYEAAKQSGDGDLMKLLDKAKKAKVGSRREARLAGELSRGVEAFSEERSRDLLTPSEVEHIGGGTALAEAYGNPDDFDVAMFKYSDKKAKAIVGELAALGEVEGVKNSTAVVDAKEKYTGKTLKAYRIGLKTYKGDEATYALNFAIARSLGIKANGRSLDTMLKTLGWSDRRSVLKLDIDTLRAAFDDGVAKMASIDAEERSIEETKRKAREIEKKRAEAKEKGESEKDNATSEKTSEISDPSESTEREGGEAYKGNFFIDKSINEAKLNRTQRDSVKRIRALAKYLDGFTFLITSEGTLENGKYTSEKKTVQININAGKLGAIDGIYDFMLDATWSHELGHAIKENSPRKFEELKEFIKENFYTAGSWDAAVRLRLEQYRAAEKGDGESFTYEDAEEEVVVNSLGKMLSSETVMEKLAGEHRSLFARIWKAVADFFDKLLRKITGNTPIGEYSFKSREERIAAEGAKRRRDELEKMFADALISANEAAKASKTVKYSNDNKTAENGGNSGVTNTNEENVSVSGAKWSLIDRTEDGRGVYHSNYPPDTPKDVKQRDIVTLVQNVWSKKPIKLNLIIDGKNVPIDAKFNPELTERSDLSKIAFGNRKGTASEKRITMNLSSDFYQIAEESHYVGSKNETGKDNAAHTGVTTWHYFITNLVYVEADGTEIECYMNIDVKENDSGNWFYSFAIEKGSCPADVLSVVTDKSATTSTISISDSGEKSNSFSENSLENSEKSKKSLSDREYLAAIERGDMNAVQAMVDEAARAAGYTDKLYHGTHQFGFTEFDPSYSDDKISIFVAGNPDLAQTYSGRYGSRPISDSYKVDGLSIEEVVDRLNKEAHESYDGEELKIEYEIMRQSDVNKLINEVNDGVERLQETVGNKIKEYAARMASDFNDTDAKTHKALMELKEILEYYQYEYMSTPIYMLLHYTDAFENGAKVAELEYKIRLMNKLAHCDTSDGVVVKKDLDGYGISILYFDEARADLKSRRAEGNYALYGNPRNQLLIEGNGQNWNDIRGWAKAIYHTLDDTEVERKGDYFRLYDKKTGNEIFHGRMAVNTYTEGLSRRELHISMVDKANNALEVRAEYHHTTRDIARFAKDLGYESVKFENIEDNGGQGRNAGAGDVYAYFEPNNLKSADPVTYDDEGNIIPLSERFNENKRDIRYSLSDRSLDNEADAEYNKNKVTKGKEDGSYDAGSKNSKVLEQRTISTVDRGEDSQRKLREDSEEIYKRLADGSNGKRGDGGERAGSSGWLGNSRRNEPALLRLGKSVLRDLRGKRLSDTDTAGRLLSDEVREAFAETVLKNENGEPLSLYHWTDAAFKIFEKGDIGFHFGTLNAAHMRYINRSENQKIYGSFYKEVYLNIKSPAIIDLDPNTWDAFSLSYLLNRQSIITDEEIEKLELEDGFYRSKYNSEASISLRHILEERGYDGIIYTNDIEGDLSVMAFYPHQIHTVAENGLDVDSEALGEKKIKHSLVDRLDRVLLADAMSELALNKKERDKIAEYRDEIYGIGMKIDERDGLIAEYKELKGVKGKNASERRNALDRKINELNDYITGQDARLIDIIQAQPLKDVLLRYEKQAYEAGEKRVRDIYADRILMSRGQHQKFKAEYTRDKVYDKSVAEKAVKSIPHINEIPKKSRDKLIDTMWEMLNTVDGENAVNRFVETMSKRIYYTINQESKSPPWDTLSQEETAEFERDILGVLRDAFDTGGKDSRIIEELKKAREKADWEKAKKEKLQGKINDLIEKYEILRNLDALAQRIRAQNFGAFVNASERQGKVLTGLLRDLASFEYRKKLARSKIREKLIHLLEWYTPSNELLHTVRGEDNEIVSSDYKQEIYDAIEDIAAGNGNLTTAELRTLYDVLSYFSKFAEDYNKVWKHGRLVDAKSEAERFVEQISFTQEVVVGTVRRLINNGYYRFFGDPMSLARAADGYEVGFYQTVMELLRQKQIEAQIAESDALAEYNAFLDRNPKYSKEVSENTVEYRGYNIPKIKLITIYMTLKREDSWRGFLKNGFSYMMPDGKTEFRPEGILKDTDTTDWENEDFKPSATAELQKIGELLTDTDLEFISILENGYNVFSKNLKYDADMKRLGYARVSDGYYHPLLRNGIAYGVEFPGWETLDMVSRASFNKSVEKNAHELKILSADALFVRHIHEVTQYAYLWEAIDYYDKVSNITVNGNKGKPVTINTEIKGYWENANKYFRNMIGYIQGRTPKGDEQRLLALARSNYARFQLGANPKVWVTQLSSMISACNIIDAGAIARGLLIDASEVDEYCPLARLRHEDNTAAMAQGVFNTASRGGRAANAVVEKTSKLGDLLMVPIGKMDRIVIKKLFGACQVQVEKDGGASLGTVENKKAAGKLLERVILETQQNTLGTERSAAMRSDNEFIKSIVMFSADSVKAIARLFDALGEYATMRSRAAHTEGAVKESYIKRKNEAKRKLVKSSVTLITNSAFMVLIGALFKFLQGKDDDDEWWEFALDGVGNLLGGLPVIRDAWSTFSQGFDIGTPAMSMIGDIVNGAASVMEGCAKLISGDGSIEKLGSAFKKLCYAIGQMLGVPARNIYNSIKGTLKRFVSPFLPKEVAEAMNDFFA